MLNQRQFNELVKCRDLYSNYYINNNNTEKRTNVCPPNFDKDLCWDSVEVNTTSFLKCPFNEHCNECTLPESETLVYKQCFANGSWSGTDYTKCVYIFQHATQVKCASVNCYLCHDINNTVSDISLYLASASLVLLLICLVVFNAYRRLQSMRITIRKHLCSAFAMRFVAVVLFSSISGSSAFFRRHSQCHHLNIDVREGLCKLVLFVQLYGTNASIWWMFVEGIYLSSRLSTFGMHSEGSLVLYCFIGWGTPFIWSFVWALLMEMAPHDKKPFCWMPYTSSDYRWIIAVPMLTALVANFVILLVVVGILVQKLWAENSHEDRKLRKTIKATLMLVPLLGIPNLLVFYKPSQKSILPYYMISCAILQNSQGIFLHLAYCIFNKEVTDCLKRSYRSIFPCLVSDPVSQTCEPKPKKRHFWMISREWASPKTQEFMMKHSTLTDNNHKQHIDGEAREEELTKLNQDPAVNHET